MRLRTLGLGGALWFASGAAFAQNPAASAEEQELPPPPPPPPGAELEPEPAPNSVRPSQQLPAQGVPPASQPAAAPLPTPEAPRPEGSRSEARARAPLTPRFGPPPLPTSRYREAPAPVDSEPDEPERVRRWYGWKTLIADGGSLVLVVAGAADTSGTLLTAGVAGYILAPPIVHFAHKNPGRGFLSLGVRVLLPTILIAAAADGGDGDAGAAVGAGLLGLAAAVSIDAFALARDTVERPARSTHSASIVPSAAVGRDGLWLGAAGAF